MISARYFIASGRRSDIKDIYKISAFFQQIQVSRQTLSSLLVFYNTQPQSKPDKCHILRNNSKLVKPCQKSRQDPRF